MEKMVGVAGLAFGYASLLSLTLHLLRPSGLSNPVLILRLDGRKKMVEHFWEKANRTILYNPFIIKILDE